MEQTRRPFFNYLIIYQVQTKEIITMMAFEYQILILLFLRFFPLFQIQLKRFTISCTRDHVLLTFPSCFLGVCKCGKPRSLEFDILLRLQQLQAYVFYCYTVPSKYAFQNGFNFCP